MTTTLDRATGPVLSVADAPVGSPGPTGVDLPGNVQCWDDVLLLPWGVDTAERPLILLDAHLLFTCPPDGAETLADVVRRVAS